MNGTGFSDLFIEAGLLRLGSLNGVLSGKNYSRAINCHKTVVEAFERLILDDFFDKNIDTPSQESMGEALGSDLVQQFLSNMETFTAGISHGSHGKTAQLWMPYIDLFLNVVSLIRAVKTNNFSLYVKTLFDMIDLFFAFDGQDI